MTILFKWISYDRNNAFLIYILSERAVCWWWWKQSTSFFFVFFFSSLLTGGLDDKNRDLFSRRAFFFKKGIALDSWKKRFFERSERWLKITWNFYRYNFLLVRVFFSALRFAVHFESKKNDENDLNWIYACQLKERKINNDFMLPSVRNDCVRFCQRHVNVKVLTKT